MVPTHTHTHRSHLQRLFNYVCVGGEVTKRHSDSKRAEDEMTALIQLSSRLVTYLYVMSDDTRTNWGYTRYGFPVHTCTGEATPPKYLRLRAAEGF